MAGFSGPMGFSVYSLNDQLATPQTTHTPNGSLKHPTLSELDLSFQTANCSFGCSRLFRTALRRNS